MLCLSLGFALVHRVFGLSSDFKEGIIFSTYATLVSSVMRGKDAVRSDGKEGEERVKVWGSKYILMNVFACYYTGNC